MLMAPLHLGLAPIRRPRARICCADGERHLQVANRHLARRQSVATLRPEARVQARCPDVSHGAYAARPKLKDRDFFVTGESYAGHYIPAFSHHVWRTNRRKAEGDRIKLRGLAIGDGG